jgi:FMN-dependent NADH-azoreductase
MFKEPCVMSVTNQTVNSARLLQINSSVFGEGGQSSQLANRFVAEWQKHHPSTHVLVRDVSGDEIPHLNGTRVQAFFTPAEQRSAEQQAIIDYSDALIHELQQADVIVLGLPLYNFGVPSQLKAYFDHIARAGVTFRYTENGPEGLVKGKKVYVFAARGGLYEGTKLDTQTDFVRNFLAFIGITDVEFIYAEGLSIPGKKDAALVNANAAIDKILSERIAA